MLKNDTLIASKIGNAKYNNLISTPYYLSNRIAPVHITAQDYLKKIAFQDNKFQKNSAFQNKALSSILCGSTYFQLSYW